MATPDALASRIVFPSGLVLCVLNRSFVEPPRRAEAGEVRGDDQHQHEQGAEAELEPLGAAAWLDRLVHLSAPRRVLRAIVPTLLSELQTTQASAAAALGLALVL